MQTFNDFKELYNIFSGHSCLQLNKSSEGQKMLAKEIELYPESKVFIDRILKKLEK
jgi:hypothetical protein